MPSGLHMAGSCIIFNFTLFDGTAACDNFAIKEMPMKCPSCGQHRFYVKDPEDEFETISFDCSTGRICFDSEIPKDDIPEISDSTHIYCDKCAWNGGVSEIKKQ
jgi:hypothetical protein